jgi:hypothetical protein
MTSHHPKFTHYLDAWLYLKQRDLLEGWAIVKRGLSLYELVKR